ncbi:hypothetical protein JOC86_000461 [Bacillus pakistanensis]|uniref:site-specific DNA-methyltransferase (adenine-specific) n=1 Tax=Rossellomorea pakistanensis TaxID=992288 RepID=A0ABS2N836_9BACI|nr:BREX-1 system adenine-specific DNA-methyltransferase PglX [Bacillus pakistanensis]MBM7583924.1 hypothetical protein [Bacillus pakistanensis]
MNKTELKNFAVSARRDLLEKVALRAKIFGIDEKNGLTIEEKFGQLAINGETYSNDKKSAFLSLKKQLAIKGYEQLMEEVAYTWFNRIIAIRYMEVNEYLPERVNVLSSSTGKVEPDILSEFETIDLGIDTIEIKDLIRQGEIEDAYRELFIAQCNALHNILPFLFEQIHDYTELLLPDFLLDSESVISQLVKKVSNINFHNEEEGKDNVEVLGWLYQYYMSEKKEKVGGLKNTAVKKEDLPVVTQLFTPKWIVQYMVQNSLGKLYDEKYPNNNLAKKWEYYLKTNNLENHTPKFTALEEVKVIDPACGSGHILLYAFDMLYEMYEEAGYPSREIPKLILEKNLYGLDIDKRAQQIANFALVMKAVEKSPRFLRRNKDIKLNIIEIVDTDLSLSEEAISFFAESQSEIDEIRELQNIFKNGKQFGSLINPNEEYKDLYIEWLLRIENYQNQNVDLIEEVYIKELEDKLFPLILQALLLVQKYDVSVTNPPYHNKFNPSLKQFMNTRYKDYKSDLFSAFIYKTGILIKKNGFSALMTPYTWLFNSSNEKLRKYIVTTKSISSLVLLEYSAFKDATVPICSFVIQNQTLNQSGEYVKLTNLKGDQAKYVKDAASKNVKYRYTFNCSRIKNIDGNPLSFWATEKVHHLLKEELNVGKIAELKAGLSTGNNDIFQRNWFEVSFNKIGFNYNDIKETRNLRHKWFPCNSGGDFRKWYGNNSIVINWFNNGEDIRSYRGENGKLKSAVRNDEYYFKEGVTWTKLSSSNFGARYKEKGFIFDDTGRSAFSSDEEETYLLIALFCSNISKEIMSILNPTLSFTNHDIARIPYREMNQSLKKQIVQLSESNIKISKSEWDSFETSWNFIRHPFINIIKEEGFSNLDITFKHWSNFTESNIRHLKWNEEQINSILIEHYDLQSDFYPKISDRDITIRNANRVRDTKSFLSYFIGCIMGRYSLNIEGLTYAGGKWDDSKYETFIPNKFGLIQLTDGHYFEDDIIARLREFLLVTFGVETVEENLQWLAESLELKRNETAEERLRRYFLDEFFKDHCQIYQKRPIYWLVDSGKQKGLRTFIYMHRYQPDTMATIRFEHLQEIQAKYNNEIAAIDLRIVNPNLNASEKRDLEKRKTAFQKRLEELLEFDKKLVEYANAQIDIDLDDGVKVNYAKFEKVLAKI